MNFKNILIAERYRVSKELNSSSGLTVCLGEDIELKKTVLLKFYASNLITHYEVDKLCFANEYQQIKGFDHENIVKLLYAGDFDNGFCVVTEYYDVVTLDDFFCSKDFFDLETSINIILQISYALAYAHEKGIIHKNLMPSNIIIVKQQSGRVIAKLLEFGMSYVIDYASFSNDRIVENFGYMSPEATGLLDRKVGSYSDLYSLGVIFYQLVTHKNPFTADTIDNIIYQQVAVAPQNPSEISNLIPESLSYIIMKLLNKDPDLRYRSAVELCNDIDSYIRGDNRPSTNQEILNLLNSRSKYIGRSREQKKLKNIYRLASESGKLCFVNGGPGSGKSDLILSFQNEMRSDNVHILYGRFVTQSSLTPYSAFQEVLDFYVGIFEQYDNRTRIIERNRLVRLLGGMTDIVYRVNPDMKSILLESKELPSLDGYKEQQRSLMLLTKLFLNLFHGSSYIICLDDIQYADASSIALLKELAKELASYKIFILCTYRLDSAEESNTLHLFLKELKDSGVDYSEIELKPLNELQMTDYIASLLGLKKDECKPLTTYIMDKTAGNPYFTLNIIRSLLEDGVINVKNGRLIQDWTNLNNFNEKEDLIQIIQRRMERLPAEAIKLFEIAAVIGHDFSLDLLLFVSGKTEDEIHPWMEQAVSMQFIEASQSSSDYHFAHSQIREAILININEDRHKNLHRQIAVAIEKLCKNLGSKELYSLVYHYAEAGMDDEVQKYILECASLARLANATNEAIKYYEKALQIMDAQGKTMTQSCFDTKRILVELYITVGEYEKSISFCNTLMNALTDPLEKASLLCYIARGHFRQGHFTECGETLVHALDFIGDPFPDSKKKLQIATAKERIFRFYKNMTTDNPIDIKALDVTESDKILVSIYETFIWMQVLCNIPKFYYSTLHILRLAQTRMGRSKELASALAGYGSALMTKAEFKKSEDFHRAALNLRRDLSDDYGIAQSLQLLGFCYQWNGLNKQSTKFFNESAEIFNKIGDVWEASTTSRGLAYSKHRMGDYSTSIELCKKNIATCKKTNNVFGLCVSYCTIVQCYTETGNLQQAEECAMIAFDLCSHSNQPYISCRLNICYGELLIEMGQFDRATRYLKEALRIFNQNEFLPEYTGNVCSLLALSKLEQYKASKSSIATDDLAVYASEIEELCQKGIKLLSHWSNQVLNAYCIAGQLYSELEQDKLAEFHFVTGINIASQGECRYELARLHYHYSLYLTDKHRSEEARYHLFEAYMNFSAISSQGYIKLCEQLITTRYQDDLGDNMILANVSARRNRLNIDRKINTLLRLGELLTSTLELEDLQKKILQNAVELVGAERGILFLYPESGAKRLYVASIFNLGSLDYNTYDWMLDAVEKSGQPVIINDLQSDEYRRHYSIMVRYGIKSVMAMPMFVRGKLYGIIYLDSRLTRGIFSDEYMETLGFIANQGGAPIENARLYHKAITDGLTGIYGRSHFDNMLVNITADSTSNLSLSALMLDIDFFKICNDTYGHQFGDKVLRQIASIIKRVVDEAGTVFRYGGEEFVVLLNTNDLSSIMNIAEKIRSTIAATLIPFKEGNVNIPVKVTTSIGAAIWYDTMERVELIEHADRALYHSKNNGKNRVSLYCEEMDHE